MSPNPASIANDVNLTKVIPTGEFARRLKETIHRSVLKKCEEALAKSGRNFDLKNLALSKLSWILSRVLPQNDYVDLEKYQESELMNGKILLQPQTDTWYAQMIEERNEGLAKIGGNATFELIAPDQNMLSLFDAAIDFLKTRHPALGSVFEECVSHIFVGQSKDLMSFTIPKSLGSIVVAPKKSWSLPHYIEAIVHESAHVELTMRQLVDPFMKNRGTMTNNPLRKDPRPLDGTFHAALVMLRVCIALRELPPSDDRDAILEDYQSKANIALEEVSKHAQFTERGRLLFEDMLGYQKVILSQYG